MLRFLLKNPLYSFIFSAFFVAGCGMVWGGINTGFKFPNKIWVFGGYYYQTNTLFNTVYTSGDGGATWTTPTDAVLPAITSSGFPVVWQNYIYYIGGTTPDGNSDMNFVWSTQDGVNWNTNRTLPAVRADGLTLTFNGCIFEIGGTSNDEGNGALSSVLESCDGGTTWNTVGNLPNPIFLPCGTVYNNQMWVIGGATGAVNWTLYDQVYSSTDGTNWTLQGTYPYPVYSCRATVFNDAIYVIGGSNVQYNVSPVKSDVYASTNGSSWNLIGNLPGNRANGGLVVFNGNLIYIGGASGTWQTATVNTVFSSPTGATGTWTTYTLPQALSFLDNAVVF